MRVGDVVRRAALPCATRGGWPALPQQLSYAPTLGERGVVYELHEREGLLSVRWTRAVIVVEDPSLLEIVT